MNDFDERRRALLGDGGVPPYWIFKQGNSHLENGLTFIEQSGYRLSFSNGKIMRYMNYTNLTYLVLDLTTYKKVCLEGYVVPDGTYTGGVFVEIYPEEAVESISGKPLLAYSPQITSTVVTKAEADISSITGNKTLWFQIYCNNMRRTPIGYITNIWLE